MTIDINEERARRLRFARKLWEVCEGSENALVSMWALGEQLGFSKEETSRVVQYLRGEGLLGRGTLGGGICMSHRLRMEVESAIADPQHPTAHFPPLQVISIGTMVNSQIQQGTSASSQQGASTAPVDKEALSAFLDWYKRELPTTPLDEDAKDEAQAAISTLEAQLASRRPTVAIIKEAGRTLRNVAEGAAGSVLASGLALHFPQLLALFAP